MNNCQNILIVEDEEKVASFIKKGLQIQGLLCDIAFSGKQAFELYNLNTYDLIILDLGLPDISGLEVCKKLREKDKNIPILMLTALGSVSDKLSGYEVGTDDYLVKPFDFMELQVRIKALFKRCGDKSNLEAEEKISVADLELDLKEKVAKRSGSVISLTAKEFNLLEYFMRNRGRVVSKVDIAEKVWDISFDTGTNFIEVYVNYLRNKVDKGYSNKLIHTIVGMGYMLKNK
ncbi:DNA-binding response regulator [Lacihabitans sp. LS3-19]|uniref:response regulator transcription factor n=1 Tax=Lacihabitans sp. LS3-19 TaxID=2487335 RepID=UPI0020CF256A|nr:response regulator transcription factor [Lacihabitans sp. LS3-19]MCP9767926.1 DNA-binding response regulator [Lacihabitans sp. LS3-19]